MVASEMLRLNSYKKGGIGVFAVTRIFAHSVDNHMTLLRGGGNHRSARTHTKSICPSAVLGVAGKLIIRRAERGMPRKRTVLSLVNHLARMLDTNTYRKRLLHYFYSFLIKHFNRISCRMTDAKQQGVGFDILARSL